MKVRRKICLLLAFVMVAVMMPAYVPTLASDDDPAVWRLNIAELNPGMSEIGAGSADRVLIGGTLENPTYLPGFRLRNSGGPPPSGFVSVNHDVTPQRVEMRYQATNRFLEIETGTAVGGTNSAARGGDGGGAFTPMPGMTYRLVFNARMDAGAGGGLRMRGNGGDNNNGSGEWINVDDIGTSWRTISLMWTQTETGGNVVICNGTRMNPAPTAGAPRTLWISDMRIYEVIPSGETGYIFSLQPYIADMNLGNIYAGTTHLAPTHGVGNIEDATANNRVSVSIATGGNPGPRSLIVDRAVNNSTRGLLVQGVALERGDIVTVRGRVLSGAGVGMRIQYSHTPHTLGGSVTTSGGIFTLTYAVTMELAARFDQSFRIIAHNSAVASLVHIYDLTVFRPYEGIEQLHMPNPAMEGGSFAISNPYADVCWDEWYQFRAALHAHTRRSDGRAWTRETVVEHFNRGFDILAIAEHSILCDGDWTTHPASGAPEIWWPPHQWNDARNLMSAAEQSAIRDGTWNTAQFDLPPVTGQGDVGGRRNDRNELIMHEGSRFSGLGFMRPQMRQILGMPPGQAGVGLIPISNSNEQSYHNHILTYWAAFTTGYGQREPAIFTQVRNHGGLAVIAHPGRHTCYRPSRCAASNRGEMCAHAGGRGHVAASNAVHEVNRYIGWLNQFPEVLGFEIYNRPDNETRSDRILWDNVLLEMMPEIGLDPAPGERRGVWGFANDDSHSMNGTGLNWNVMLMPSLTEENTRTAMETGAFYMVARVDRRLDVNAGLSTSAGSNDHTPLMNARAPGITNISVDGQTITVEGVNYDEIWWFTGNPHRANGSTHQGGGVVISTENTLDLAQLGGYVWGNYVRAVLICRTSGGGRTNSHGVALTQPFGIFVGGAEPPLTLSPSSTTINDANLTRTITVGGTAQGEITLDDAGLPPGVTATVTGNTITLTGTRPATDVPPITGNFTVGVTRGGATQNLTVAVNLTTTWVSPTLTLTPLSTEINDTILTQTITVGGTAVTAVSLNTSALPTGVTATVDGNTITVIGVRPDTNVPPIIGNFPVGVTRGGVTQSFSVAVNLTTTWVASPPEIILSETRVVINDENLVRTITVSGTAESEITFDSEELPEEVTVTVSGNVITITGVRPDSDVEPIIYDVPVYVIRQGVSEVFDVEVHLTTTWTAHVCDDQCACPYCLCDCTNPACHDCGVCDVCDPPCDCGVCDICDPPCNCTDQCACPYCLCDCTNPACHDCGVCDICDPPVVISLDANATDAVICTDALAAFDTPARTLPRAHQISNRPANYRFMGWQIGNTSGFAYDGFSPPASVNLTAGWASAPPDFILGDVNGDGLVTSADATALARYLMGSNDGNFCRFAADITGTGSETPVTPEDLVLIARWLVGHRVGHLIAQ